METVEVLEQLADRESRVYPEFQVNKAFLANKGKMDYLVSRGKEENQDFKVPMVFQVYQEKEVLQDYKESLEKPADQANLDYLVFKVK